MVLRKITYKLKNYFYRSCKHKKPRSFLNAILFNMKIFIKQKEILDLYKCRFCNKYHCGHKNTQTTKTLNYINSIPKLTLLDF